LQRLLLHSQLNRRIKEAISSSTHLIDIQRSKVFSNEEGIWVNLKGRDPAGVIEGKDYEFTRNELKKNLENYRDVFGENPVEKVFFREQIYEGNRVNELPDLIVRPKGGIKISNFVGSSSIREGNDEVEGGHTNEGMFIFRDFQPGRVKLENRSPSIVDLFGTILYCMDIDLPKDIDSRLIVTIKDKKAVFSSTDSLRKLPQESFKMDKSEEEETKERLRSLGYL
jgi:predicted AlkP superfamily phosphohydrolase/phosphomutase